MNGGYIELVIGIINGIINLTKLAKLVYKYYN